MNRGKKKKKKNKKNPDQTAALPGTAALRSTRLAVINPTYTIILNFYSVNEQNNPVRWRGAVRVTVNPT